MLLFIVMLTSACSGIDDRQEKHIDRAQQYFIADDLIRAKIEIKNALQVDQKSIQSWYLFAQISEKQQELKEAFAAYNRVVELDPKHTDASLELAKFYVLANRHKEAKKYLDAVLVAQPNNIRGRVLEAEIMAREGEESEALARLEKIFVDDEAQARAAQLMAVLYVRQNKINRAEEILNIAIEVNPEDTAARLTLAYIFFKAERPQDTERLLKELVTLEPDEFIHRTRLAGFYTELNRFDDAEQVLRDVIEADKNAALRSLLLAEFIKHQSGAKETETELKARISIQPQAYELQFALAKFYEYDKDWLSAKNIYEQIIAVNDEHPRAVSAKRKLAVVQLKEDNAEPSSTSLAKVLKNSAENIAESFDRGKDVVTQNLFSEAIAASPEDNVLRFAYVETLLGLKEYETTLGASGELKTVRDHVEELKKNKLLHPEKEEQSRVQQTGLVITELLKKNSNDLKATEELVKLYLLQDKKSDAIKLIEQQIKDYPENSALYASLGRIFGIDSTNDKNIFEKAKQNYQKAIELKPEWQTPYLQLAGLYQLHKKDEAAEQLYQQGLQAIPGDVGLQIALAGLYESQKNYSAAKERYERVLEKNSNQLVARNNLAVILSQSTMTPDNLAKALELARPFAQADNPLLLDTLGWAHYKNKNYKQAVFYLTQAAEKKPQNAIIQYHLGMAHHKANNNKLAKKYLEKALLLDQELQEKDDVEMALAKM